MSPAMTMPLSRTRSRMSARFAGPPARGAASIRWLSIARRFSRRAPEGVAISALPRLGAEVAARAPDRAQLAVLVDRDLVSPEHVGGVRHALELEHLHRDGPLVAVLLHAKHRLDGPADELLELFGRAKNDLTR